MVVSLSGIILALSIYSHIQEELDSMPEMHPIVIPIYKEINKFFRLQYYIPVCCLLLYMDCGYNVVIEIPPDLLQLYSHLHLL